MDFFVKIAYLGAFLMVFRAKFPRFCTFCLLLNFLKNQPTSTLKSLGRDTVPVQVRPRAPRKDTPPRCVFSWFYVPTLATVQFRKCLHFLWRLRQAPATYTTSPRCLSKASGSCITLRTLHKFFQGCYKSATSFDKISFGFLPLNRCLPHPKSYRFYPPSFCLLPPPFPSKGARLDIFYAPPTRNIRTRRSPNA